MKPIFAIPTLALVFMAVTVTYAKSLTSEQVAACQRFGRAAYNVMISRQLGVPQTDLLGQFDNPSGLVVAIVTDAYAVPRFDADADKVRVSEDFRDESETLCVDWFQSDSEGN